MRVVTPSAGSAQPATARLPRSSSPALDRPVQEGTTVDRARVLIMLSLIVCGVALIGPASTVQAAPKDDAANTTTEPTWIASAAEPASPASASTTDPDKPWPTMAVAPTAVAIDPITGEEVAVAPTEAATPDTPPTLRWRLSSWTPWLALLVALLVGAAHGLAILHLRGPSHPGV